MKIYRARTFGNVTVHDDVGAARQLPHRLDLMRLSPSGFAWGYYGQGVRQLALALIADATGDDDHALMAFDRFARDPLARRDRWAPFEMSDAQVRDRLGIGAEAPDKRGW